MVSSNNSLEVSAQRQQWLRHEPMSITKIIFSFSVFSESTLHGQGDILNLVLVLQETVSLY